MSKVRLLALGRVPPGRRRRRQLITSGYLVEATSVEALAGKIGVDAAGLRETVQQHNRFAEAGEDQEIGKGRDVSIVQVYRCILPFVAADFVRLAVLTAFPGVTLFLVRAFS